MTAQTKRFLAVLLAGGFLLLGISFASLASITADAGGPYAIAEGDAVSLNATQCTSTSPIVSYEWDLDGAPGAEVTRVAPLVPWSALAAAGIDDNGAYIITLSIENEDAETDSTTATINVSNTAPVVDAGHTYDIDEGDSLALDGSGTFDYGDDALGPYDWDLDGDKDYSDGVTGATPNVSWAQLEGLSVNDDGEYTIWLRVADEDGATGESSARLTIHNTPPVAQDTGGPYEISEGDDLHLTGTASDISSADTFSYVWDIDGAPIGDPDFDDGVAVANKVVPWHVLVQFGLGDGPSGHTVRLTVMDDDGSISSDSAPLTILNTDPVITVCPAALTTYYDDPVEDLTGAFFDPGTDTWTGTVDWKDGNVNPLTINSTAQTFKLPDHTYLTAPPGETDYDVEISVIDDDAGEGTCTFTITVIHDITPPVVTLTSVPDPISNVVSPTLKWEGTDDFTPTNEIVYSWRLDGGAWSAWSTDTQVQFIQITQGAHVFEVKAKDLAGNVSDPVETEWRTDVSEPVIEIYVPEFLGGYILASTVLADWRASDAVASVVSTTATVPSGDPLDTSTVGVFPFMVQATDLAGNVGMKTVPYRIVPAVVPTPPEGTEGIDLRMVPSFGPPEAPMVLWSFLNKPLEGAYNEDGELIIEPLRYVRDEPIGVSFQLANALGNLLVYDTGNVWIDVSRIVPSGFIEEYELVAFYEVPYDPVLEVYATEIPYGDTENDWWALTPGVYKLSLTLRAVWLESLEIQTVWIEILE